MKILFTIFILLIMVSCNQDTSQNKEIKSNSVDLKISDNKDIFGSWTMCATSGNGMMIQMNVCKTVVFNSNGTGYIENNSFIKENFVWSLKTPGLKIFYGNKNPNSTFGDTTYYASFTKQKEGIDLILTHNDQSYYLSK